MMKPLPIVCSLLFMFSATGFSADPLIHWKLDESAGSVAQDSFGVNHGELIGNTSWDPAGGMFGGAAVFDGTDDSIRVTAQDGPFPATDYPFTLMAWVKTTDAKAKAVMVCMTEVSNRYYWIGMKSGRACITSRTDTMIESVGGPTGLNDDTWHHICGVYSSPNVFMLYVDGEEVATYDHSRDFIVGIRRFAVGALDRDPDGENIVDEMIGAIDDVAIFAEALDGDTINGIMLNGIKGSAEKALAPVPDDGTTDISWETELSWTPGEFAGQHDVYLGTDFEDVNAAGATDAAYQGRQAENNYDPGSLTLDTTYYWRIDEVNATPDQTVFKGHVWSFTVEPVSYAVPVGAVTATASSATNDQEPENTVNGSGLNEADGHSNQQEHMWLCDTADTAPWIQYRFGQPLKLDKVHVWNHNTQTESILGFGIQEALIAYSTDGENWSEWGTVTLMQATGSMSYTGHSVDLQGIIAQHVRITGLSNYSLLGLPQMGLSEVRFYSIPVMAREPVPTQESVTAGVDVTLDWRTGREAVEHEVVFSQDEQAVIDGSAVLATVSESTYPLDSLDLGTAYFWKINEVNDLGTPPVFEGDLWTFQTPDHLVVDDFEMYRAQAGMRIWEYWIDGFENPGDNGAVVGNDDDAEKTVVYQGNQSMPIAFNNTTAPVSEVTRFFDTPVDLIQGNAESLKLQVRGNAPGFVENGDGTLTVGAAGVDIWGTADDFRFVAKRLSGDGSITARVDSCSQADIWTKAGIMIRENLSEDATNSYSFVTPTGRVGTQWRVDTFGTTVSTRSEAEGEITLPTWVRLTRQGTLFTGEQSVDGVNWQPMFQSGTPTLPTEMDIDMISDVYIGLAVTSHATGVSAAAVFSEVTTTGNVTGPWISEGIGADTHPDNDAAPIYLRLADTSGREKVFDHPNPEITTVTVWDEWTIPMGDLSPVNPAQLDSITIGVSGAGVEGKLFIDAIRTHKAYPATTE